MGALDQRARKSVAVSLLSCFDFVDRGFVDRESWRRGTGILMLSDVGNDDALWTKLVGSYGSDAAGDSKHESVDIGRIPEHAPLAGDTVLMSHVMRALIGSVASLTEEVEVLKTLPRRTDENREEIARLARASDALRGQAIAHDDTRKARAILDWRRRIQQPALHAWAELAAAQRKARRLAVLNAASPGLCRCWERWRALTANQFADLAALLRTSDMAVRAAQVRRLSRLLLIALDCSRSLLITFDCFWWLLVASGGFWWLLVASGGFWWLLMASDGF